MNILIIDRLFDRGNSFYQHFNKIENGITYFIKGIGRGNAFEFESVSAENDISNISFDLLIAHVNDYFGDFYDLCNNLKIGTKIFYGGDEYHNNVRKVNNEGFLINRKIYTDGFITEQESKEIIEFIKNNYPTIKTPKLLGACDSDLNELFDGFFEARRNNNLESEKLYKSKLTEYASKQK
jgi:hypothetical protein